MAEVIEAEQPVMSWINVGEVFYVVRRAHGEDAAAETIRDLRTVVAAALPSPELVLDAARIKADHRLSYADAFAAATAIANDAVLLTGDPELLTEEGRWRWEDLRSGP